MERSDSQHLLRQLRTNLLSPYILLVVLTIVVNAVLYHSAKRLDDFSWDSAEHLFNSLVQKELGVLAQLTRDYSYWYETVDKLAINFDPVWVVSDLQMKLRDHYEVSSVYVLGPDLQVLLAIDQDLVRHNPGEIGFSPSIHRLFEQVMTTDLSYPQPVTGVVLIGDTPYLTAVSSLTPDVVARGMDATQSYGLLVFSKRLEALLPGWSREFGLGDARLAATGDNADASGLTVDLPSLDGEVVAKVRLQPRYPGEAYIRETLPWVALFAISMLLLSLFFIIRVRRYSGAADKALHDLGSSELALKQSQQRLQDVIDGAHLGYWDWDYATGGYRVNDRCLQMIGVERSQFDDHVSFFLSRIHNEDIDDLTNTIELNIMLGKNYNAEFRIAHQENQWVWLEMAGAVVEREGENPVRLSGTFQDISERKQFEAWLERQATRDHLTGLYNRGEIDRLVKQELARAERYRNSLTVFMLDIDHFKVINDRYGHQAGDIALKTIATTLLDTLRESDLVGRYGGEEFIILLPETSGEQGVELANRLLSVIAETPVVTDSGEFNLTVSIGVTTYPNGDDDPLTLVKQADRALYAAKEGGRNRVCDSSHPSGEQTIDPVRQSQGG